MQTGTVKRKALGLELPGDDHSHLVCDRCEAACDAEDDYPDLIVPRSQRSYFVIGRAEVVFTGLCDHCAEATKRAVDR
jgi:Fe2+ or Zn2+ uptake regulation protein